jgi:hypothetical protein
MKKAFGCLMVIGFVILAYVFFVMWRGASPLGVGTGSIGGHSSARPEAGSTPDAKPASKGSAISQIASNPQKWKGRRVTVTGRVRGNTRYASNRNLYRLTDGESSLLIVDDKTPPKELAQRSVKGIVKVLKPPVGEGYAYIVSAKGDPKIDLSWNDAKGFFTEEFQKIKKDVNAATAQ